MSRKASPNGDMPPPRGTLAALLGAIRRAQDQGEREEQAAFWRTHKARERALRARARGKGKSP